MAAGAEAARVLADVGAEAVCSDAVDGIVEGAESVRARAPLRGRIGVASRAALGLGDRVTREPAGQHRCGRARGASPDRKDGGGLCGGSGAGRARWSACSWLGAEHAIAVRGHDERGQNEDAGALRALSPSSCVGRVTAIARSAAMVPHCCASVPPIAHPAHPPCGGAVGGMAVGGGVGRGGRGSRRRRLRSPHPARPRRERRGRPRETRAPASTPPLERRLSAGTTPRTNDAMRHRAPPRRRSRSSPPA